MVEARGIEGVCLPFAAGVVAGTFLVPFLPERSMAASMTFSVAMTLVVVASVSRQKVRNIAPEAFTALLLTATGLFCAFSSATIGSVDLNEGPLERLATRALETLKARIDGIPYPTSTTAPLVKALLTGDRSDIPKEIVTMFRTSGASHILALSGLHLGVIYLILSRLVSPLGNSRTSRVLKYFLIVAAAGFYTIMTGAGPSITRAFLFIFLNETARILGRERNLLRTLLAALTIQMAISPTVVTSIGFQLSYLAMAGIAILFPPLERLYPEPKSGFWKKADPMRKVWSAATLSISCQAFTAPLAWYRFHTFPEYFLITNLIAMPMTSAIMVLSVLTIALSFAGACPGFIVWLDDQAVSTLVYCLDIISQLDGSL